MMTCAGHKRPIKCVYETSGFSCFSGLTVSVRPSLGWVTIYARIHHLVCAHYARRISTAACSLLHPPRASYRRRSSDFQPPPPPGFPPKRENVYTKCLLYIVPNSIQRPRIHLHTPTPSTIGNTTVHRGLQWWVRCYILLPARVCHRAT